MTLRDHDGVPADVLAMYTVAELAEIAARKPAAGLESPDAIGYAWAWELHVEKLDNDRALPWTDHRVWTEHDLAGALFQRDFLAAALDRLRPELAAKVAVYAARTDDRFRSFTVEDSGIRMATVAALDVRDIDPRTHWWWYRVPSSGPIVRDLRQYLDS